MAALNITCLIAERASLVTVARSSARVLAIREVASALLLADAVVFFDDLGALA